MKLSLSPTHTVYGGYGLTGIYQKFGAAPMVTVVVAAARASADVSRLASESYCAVAAWAASESMVVWVYSQDAVERATAQSGATVAASSPWFVGL